MVTLPPGNRPTVAVVPLGTPADDHVAAAAAGVAVYGIDVTVEEPIPAPDVGEEEETEFDVDNITPEDFMPSTPPNALPFLATAIEGRSTDATVVVTDHETHTEEQRDVFGLAYPEWNAALVATGRLDVADGPAEERICTVVTKNVAGMFGLANHDPEDDADCLLFYTQTVWDVDALPDQFCAGHRDLLEPPATAPAPPEWAVRPRRDEQAPFVADWVDIDDRGPNPIREWVDRRSPATRAVIHELVGTGRFLWRLAKLGLVLVMTLLILAAALDPYESIVGPAGAGFVVVGGLLALVVSVLLLWLGESVLFGLGLGAYQGLSGETGRD